MVSHIGACKGEREIERCLKRVDYYLDLFFGVGGCLNYLFDDLHALEQFDYIILGYNYIVSKTQIS